MTRTFAALVLVLAVGGCDCDIGPGAERAPRARVEAWTNLSYCLAGSERPTPELLERIGMSAEVENIDEVPDPPGRAGVMGGEPEPRRVRRVWPRRCAHLGDALSEELREEPEEHLAQRVTDALWNGEVDPALYSLVQAMPAADPTAPTGVTPPPPPASPLPHVGLSYLVAGSGCAPEFVVRDASVEPPRQILQIRCRGGVRHQCTIAGAGLASIECRPAAEPIDRWDLREAAAGPWTLAMEGTRGRCQYVARGPEEVVLGDFPCPETERFWTRACRAGDFVGAAFVRLDGARLGLRVDGAFHLVEPPERVESLLTCTPEALLFYDADATWEFVDEDMRSHMIRPPSRDVLRVTMARCTAAGCESSRQDIVSFGSEGAVAPLGEKVLVVEIFAREGSGLLTHFAPFEELAATPGRWVLAPTDDIELAEHVAWALGEDTALLFLGDAARGVFALRFDAEGNPSHVTTTRSAADRRTR